MKPSPFIVSPGDYNFAKQLQIEGDVKDTELTIELASGKSLEVSVVNPNGEPVPTAILNGTAESSGWYPSRDGGVTIEGYYADTGRDFFAYDPQSHQAAYVQLTGPQKGEIVVTLKPAGSVRGRIVDKQGVAVSSVRLLCDSIPEDNSGNPALRNTTDKDGKFELRGAVPGYKHTVWALIWGKEMLAIAKDVDVEPTNGLDLGDVVFDIN